MTSVVSMFQAIVEKRSTETAMRSRSLGVSKDGSGKSSGDSTGRSGDLQWGSMTWAEYGTNVEMVAGTLIEWGVKPGDRVALLSENRWEWHVVDVAVMMIGGITVPLYPTSSAAQSKYILDHCAAEICVVSTADQLGKVASLLPDGLAVRRILVLDERSPHWPEMGDGVRSWSEMRVSSLASTRRTEAVERARAIAGTDIATIVYTSGTTGPPKGVMLTHANITATLSMVTTVVPLKSTDRFLSFLPLSHIAERVVSHFGHIASGGETWFAESFSSVATDMAECRPTVFFAVPRVWEKLRDSFEVELHRQPVLQRVLVSKYVHLGQKVFGDRDAGSSTSPLWLAAHKVLDNTIGRRIRDGIGLGRARALYSGAAPTDPELLRWLRTLGLFVGEVYGQTEVCGPTTVGPLKGNRIGTVGQPLPGVGVKIADDGEILVKGDNVCVGYYRDQRATSDLFDDDGWMRSGDLGMLDANGFLKITGRKKDLMKTAHGKYIAPQELETRLRSTRFIANAVVVAEGRPFVTALLTLDAEAVTPWAEHRGKLLDLESLSCDPDVLAEVGRQVDAVNREVSKPEQVKRWHILPREFTVEGGELTPTLKVVRSAVMKHFDDDIASLYPSTTTSERTSRESA